MRREHCSLRLLLIAYRIVEVFLADGVFLGQRSYPVEVGFGHVQPRLLLREFLLPYTAVRTAQDPDATLLRFLQSTYDAAAELGNWDRAALEARR